MKTLLPVVAVFTIALFSSCTPTTTTLRFRSNHEAVMVRNPENPKPGDRLEVLVGTRKKIFFYVTRGAAVTSLNAAVDPTVGGKKLLAELSIDQHPLRIFVVQPRRPLTITGPPTPENKALTCSNPTIANLLGGASTEIVGVGRGSWIATSSSSRRLFLRPTDPDLVILVDVDGLDSARATDFVLRIGSLTFEPGR